MKYLLAVSIVALLLLTSLPALAALDTSQVPRMAPQELVKLLGDPNVVILDARQPGDWDQSDSKIKGAVRVDPKAKIGTLLDTYPKDKTIVLYCS